MSLPQVEDKNLNALAHAIRSNDTNTVHSILEVQHGIANREYGSKHPTFLHFAIWLDSSKTGSAVAYDIYRLLVHYGADVNKADRAGHNCLLYALSYPIIRHDPHSIAKLNLLVKATANLNYQAPGMGTFTALLAAIRVQSTLPIAEQLISRWGVDLNQPALYPQNRKLYPISCAMLNHVPPTTIESLIKHGADLSRPDPRGRDHPLFLCVEHPRMPVEYLRIIIKHGMDASVLNGKGQNALQALLARQIEPATIRTKIRLLIQGGVDVRSPIIVGSVSSEKMSILHYLIHDGITTQHHSEATSQIGQQLSREFTQDNYEFAKITFHRTKSLRSRETVGNLQAVLSPGGSATQLHVRGGPGSPTAQAPGSANQTRSTLPRASEHSLRFSVSTNELGEQQNQFSSPISSPRSTMSNYNLSTPTPVFSNSSFSTPSQQRLSTIDSDETPAQSTLMIDVDTGMPTPGRSISTEMNDGDQDSPLRDSGSAIFGLPLSPNVLNATPSLQRQSSHSSTSTNASTASFQTGRSQRSYATMASYLTLPEETIKRIDNERSKQDEIDAQDLADTIVAAINLIYIDFDPVLAHFNGEPALTSSTRTRTSVTSMSDDVNSSSSSGLGEHDFTAMDLHNTHHDQKELVLGLSPRQQQTLFHAHQQHQRQAPPTLGYIPQTGVVKVLPSVVHQSTNSRPVRSYEQSPSPTGQFSSSPGSRDKRSAQIFPQPMGLPTASRSGGSTSSHGSFRGSR